MRATYRKDLPEVSVDPSNLRPGNLWHNTTEECVKFYDGNATRILSYHNTSDIAWVDSSADSALSKVGFIGKPFQTIEGALGAVSTGQSVVVLPGTYTENSLTIPTGVSLIGHSGAFSTIIQGASSTGTRVILSENSFLSGFSVEASTDASAGVTYSGAFKAQIGELIISGGGTSGIGVQKSGAGFLSVSKLDYYSGDIGILLNISQGSLKANTVNVFGGLVNQGINSSNSTSVINDLYIESSTNLNTGVALLSGSLSINSMKLLTGTTGLNIKGNNCSFGSGCCDLFNTSTNILIDEGLTDGFIEVRSGHLDESTFSISSVWDFSTTNLSFDEKIWSNKEIGHIEYGRTTSLGEGGFYSRGVMVVTTDSSASPSSDGSNLTDESSSNTISFQGTASGNSILFGSKLGGKFWGIVSDVLSASVESSPNSFIFEIWDGASWVEISFQSRNLDQDYTYSNSVFIRTAKEVISFGLDEASTWSPKTILGEDLYWVRVRIDTGVTTAPIFNPFKLVPSFTEVSSNGTSYFYGNSRPLVTLEASGNVFGESGGVYSGSLTIGSGITPSSWDHNLPNCLLNGNGDAIYTQFPLEEKLDTSMPIYLDVYFQTNNPVASPGGTITVSTLAISSEGIPFPDPSGGIPPISRSLSQTPTADVVAGKVDNVARDLSGDQDIAKKIQRMRVEGFSLNGYYPGDLYCVRIELDNDASPNQDVTIWMVTIKGYAWRS